MNKSEAQKILGEQLARFRSCSRSELASLVETQHVEVCDVRGTSGTTYQVEMQFFWDARPGQTIRVVCSIDDGGIRVFAPLTDSLLVSQAAIERYWLNASPATCTNSHLVARFAATCG